MLYYNYNLKSNARKLRRNQTDAERLLWYYIRRKQIHNVQFYRQKPLGKYIADFFAPTAKLIIEVDGGQHFEKQQAQYDSVRNAYFFTLGFCILRFDNLQVLTSTQSVLEVIYDAIQKNPPYPPFAKGGPKSTIITYQ